jgi:hypothetical protein
VTIFQKSDVIGPTAFATLWFWLGGSLVLIVGGDLGEETVGAVLIRKQG